MDCDQYTLNDTTLSVEDFDMLCGYDKRRPVQEDPQELKKMSVEDRTPVMPMIPKCKTDMPIGNDGRYQGYPYRVGGVNPYAGGVEGFSGVVDFENPSVVMMIIVVVLIAVCVYMLRSLGEMRDTLRELLIVSRIPYQTSQPVLRA